MRKILNLISALILVFIAICLLLPAAIFAVDVVPKTDFFKSLSIWHLGLIIFTVATAWAAIRGRVIRLEQKIKEVTINTNRTSEKSANNETKLFKLKSEITDKLLEQERLFFDKMYEQLHRLESKIDRLIEVKHGPK